MTESRNADADDLYNTEFWQKTIEKGIEEIQEMQSKWGKEETNRWYSIEEDKQIHDEYLLWKKQFRKLADIKYKHCLCAPQKFSIPMERHHVSKWEYVYVPKNIHQHVSHKLGDGKLEGVIG